MKSFINTRNKIKSIDNLESNNFKLINIYLDNNRDLKEQFTIKKSLNYYSKVIYKIETNWEYVNTNFIYTETNLHGIWKNWTVDWSIFDIRLLPYLKCNVLTRNLIKPNDFYLYYDTSPQITHRVIDISNDSNYMKQITTNIAFTYAPPDDWPIDDNTMALTEVKLICSFVNPRNYA